MGGECPVEVLGVRAHAGEQRVRVHLIDGCQRGDELDEAGEQTRIRADWRSWLIRHEMRYSCQNSIIAAT